MDTTTQPRRSAPEKHRLRAGAVLGRYVVVRFIGAGGNGEVWAAYDQTLRRTVALKLLREAEAPDGGWSALLDEAQSLARLSHPNVVAVHDVVRDGARVFICMELVDGTDLREWLRAEKRSWRERLHVLLEAGRGLQAAHAAGVVHGDFKPANVLVDATGRARVVDFGLAQIESSDPSVAGGTVPYMAPEQHAGEGPTVASDQYAFAIAVVEVLADAVPFAARSESALAQRKRGVPDAAVVARLPARLRPVLERALRPDPRDRWPSVRSLVDSLERRARPRRVVPVVALGLTAAGGLAWVSASDGEERCVGVDRELDGVWDDARRKQVLAGFAQSERAWAPDVASATVAQLDAYARTWIDARRALCEQQSQAYALRRVCLDANRVALSTAVDLLAEADEPTLRDAMQIVGGIPDVEPCLDVEIRAPRKSAPTESEIPELEAIEAQLARIVVLRAAGRYEDALDEAEAVVARAEVAGDRHDAAMAMLEVGDLRGRLDREGATEALHEALSLALATDRDDVTAKVASSLAWRAADEADLEDARRWIAHADAAADARPELLAFVENARSHVHGVAGETEPEIEAARRMLAAVEATGGAERIATACNTLAIALYRGGRLDEAAAYAQRAVDGIEQLLGGSHPRWATHALTLAGIRVSQAKHGEAAALLERAHAVALANYGEQHSTTVTIAAGLATARAYEGRYEDAERLHRAVLEARIATDAGAVQVATSRINLGLALHRLGRLDDAEHELDLARVAIAEQLGAAHPRVTYARALLADVRVDQGRIDEVTPELEALLREGGEDPTDLALVRFALARARWARDPSSPEALPLAQQARDAFAATPGFSIAVDRIDAFIERIVQRG